MRDGFLFDMYENHKLDKDAVVKILKDAGFDIGKFEVSLL